MDSSEMARRRWRNVSTQERSRLARSAALARWSLATELDRAKARTGAARAREARARALAARLLGIDASDLTDVSVEVLGSSEFRRRKSKEQNEYWMRLQEEPLPRTTCVDPEHARGAAVIHPASFRLAAGSVNGGTI